MSESNESQARCSLGASLPSKQAFEALFMLIHLSESMGMTPTLRELGESLNISRAAVHYRMKDLVRTGYINKTEGIHRRYTPTRKGWLAMSILRNSKL